jgi:hypothetical protein
LQESHAANDQLVTVVGRGTKVYMRLDSILDDSTQFFHGSYCNFYRYSRLASSINPNGKSYASGAEDGYVRLHFFDKSYLDMKDPVPEENEKESDDLQGEEKVEQQ